MEQISTLGLLSLPKLGQYPAQRRLSISNQLKSITTDSRIRRSTNTALSTTTEPVAECTYDSDGSFSPTSSITQRAKEGGSAKATVGNRQKQIKRLRMLKKLHCFRRFTREQLDLILQHAHAKKFEPGKIIIQQGEVGRELFLLEKGKVIVTRKINLEDDEELPAFVMFIESPSTFGERAIESSEPRNATVEAGNKGVSLLEIQKSDYQKIRDLNSEIVRERAFNIMRNVHPFTKIGEEALHKIAAKMTTEHFAPGGYICEQGKPGHKFYVIMSGIARVTINKIDEESGRKKELTVNELQEDAFFGEIALMEPNSLRTANIIANTDLSVLSLRRGAFLQMIEEHTGTNLKEELMKAVAVRNLQSFSGKKTAVARNKFESLELEWTRAQRILNSGQQPTKFMVLAKRIYLSFTYTLYLKCWQEMIRLHEKGKHQKLKIYGETAILISRIRTQRTATFRLRSKVQEALSVSCEKRNTEHKAVICACVSPILKDKKGALCTSWEDYHFKDLIAVMKGHEFRSGTRIVDAGSPIRNVFLILRGMVALYTVKSKTGRATFYTMARPGEFFGANGLSVAQLLKADALRGTLLMRAVSITPVELISFEARKFSAIRMAARADLTYEMKLKAINEMPLFLRDLEVNKLATLAAVVQTEQAHRDQLIIDAGQNSIQLCMILEGVVDVLVKSSESALPHIDGQSESSLGRKQMWTKVTGLGAGEYFGETGVLNFLTENKETYCESARFVAATTVVMLTLDKSNFNILTKIARNRIREAFAVRTSWRGARLLESQVARAAVEASMSQATVREDLPPHLVGSKSSATLSEFYGQALKQSGIEPAHLKAARLQKERGSSMYIQNSTSILRPAFYKGNQRERQHNYRRELSGMVQMSSISISEPSMMIRPAHWFGKNEEAWKRRRLRRLKHDKKGIDELTSVGANQDLRLLKTPLLTTGISGIAGVPRSFAQPNDEKNRSSRSRGAVVST